jgi:hypothetical protein
MKAGGARRQVSPVLECQMIGALRSDGQRGAAILSKSADKKKDPSPVGWGPLSAFKREITP